MARHRGSNQNAAATTYKSQKQHDKKPRPKTRKSKESDFEDDDVTSSNGQSHSGSGNENVNASSRVGTRKNTSGRHSYQSDRMPKGKSKKVLSSVLISLVVAFVAYYGYLGYLETRISTPLQVNKVVQRTGLDVPDRFWGSYRSGVYFGLKHRSPKSLLTGMMWLLPSQIKPGEPNLRHLCDQNDNLKTYGWLEHDGTTFGLQTIIDNNVNFTTSFVKVLSGKKGGDWTSRIDVKPTGGKQNEVVLLYYVALEPGLEGELIPDSSGKSLRGSTKELGDFVITFRYDSEPLKTSHMLTSLDTINAASYTVLSSMATKNTPEGRMFFLQTRNQNKANHGNFFVFQVHTTGNFVLDVNYQNSETGMPPLYGDDYSVALQNHRFSFDEKFDNTFNLKTKGFNESQINFAKAALSNMVGGIGYFYGHSRVQSVYNAAPVPYWSAGLYSAVPSRSFFPRGFLWDEGFHLLLINKWDPEISIDIISHWLDLMNTEGWIPREQILGDEALSRVPEEFVVQRNDVANPPTLIMALYDLLKRHPDWINLNHKATLLRMWPRLSAWFQWLNKTQSGDLPFTYRWRGRNSTTLREINPKTLASGLDDYPRASHPTEGERHLDLRCWMAVSSKLMSELAEILDYDSSRYLYQYESLVDDEMLDLHHWSDDLGSYADYGYHSDKISLQYPLQGTTNRLSHPEKIRHVSKSPQYGFVNMFGYVSIFPVMLSILKPDSPKLLQIIQKLDDPKLLWTPYGLRSLAANAPLYNKRNTEHDPPYWRGPIWINMNFLTLKSLSHYANSFGPVQTVAREKYTKLRRNIISNMVKQYYKTGYIWEQYDDSTGVGKGCRPFTGWSALIVLIMSEEY